MKYIPEILLIAFVLAIVYAGVVVIRDINSIDYLQIIGG